jgi:hypothetical protein
VQQLLESHRIDQRACRIRTRCSPNRAIMEDALAAQVSSLSSYEQVRRPEAIRGWHLTRRALSSRLAHSCCLSRTQSDVDDILQRMRQLQFDEVRASLLLQRRWSE